MNTPRKTLAAIVALCLIGATAPTKIAGTPTRTPAACTTPAGALFNPCARLDTTQVQDRRGDAPSWPMATDTVPECTEEDGSTPGQPFPCIWTGGTNGPNWTDSYVMTGPGEVYTR